MDVAEKISLCQLRVRARMPFFGALALFAEHRLDGSVPTAATDGRTVCFNPRFAAGLGPAELDAVMVHELLHAALLHLPRRGAREPRLWNIAADIVVNGIVRAEHWLRLPGQAVTDEELEDFEVEEVYDILRTRRARPAKWILDGDLQGPGGEDAEDLTGAAAAELRAHWRGALREAAVIQRSFQHGNLPAGLERLVGAVLEPQLDWRSVLWRFLVRTPVDFAGFDRRLVGRGLYLEELAGETVRVCIAVDTSGSIDSEELGQFLAELREILRLYPHIEAELYYADAELYGPHPLEEAALGLAQGGGGTSFEPFFKKMEQCEGLDAPLLVYLTDGYGTFPKRVPEAAGVLWIVTQGGLESSRFPFGEVTRLQ